MPTPASSPKAASQPANDQRVEGKDDGKPYIPFVIAVVGLAGVYWAHRLSRRRDRIARFHVAATKFREAFASDLAAVEHGNIGYLPLMDYLRAAHDERHAAAVIAFEPFILDSSLDAFRQAWQRYRYGENEDRTPAAPDQEQMNHEDLYFLCYAEGRSWETHIAASNTQKVIKRMKQLLVYAEETGAHHSFKRTPDGAA